MTYKLRKITIYVYHFNLNNNKNIEKWQILRYPNMQPMKCCGTNQIIYLDIVIKFSTYIINMV